MRNTKLDNAKRKLALLKSQLSFLKHSKLDPTILVAKKDGLKKEINEVSTTIRKLEEDR